MRKIDEKTLGEIIEKHQLWLRLIDEGERADLSDADLRRAVLSNADLSNAVLSGADLRRLYSERRITPEEGSFIGWKKASGCVIKLQVPSDAPRVGGLTGRKCRAAYVNVLSIFDGEGRDVAGPVNGGYDPNTKYEAGKTVYPDSFDDDVTEECSHGIHFFMSRHEAERW